MVAFNNVWNQAMSLFSNLFFRPDWRNLLDVVIVAFVVYQILKLFIHTRANSVLKGVGIILLLTWLSEILQLNAINWLLLQLINTGALLLVVIFQPEIRRGLEQIGRSSWWSMLFTVDRERQNAEREVQEMVLALTNLARRKVGALIVFERDTGLDDVISTGTRIDAEISAPLVENVFEPNTPLHDGAMIIRGRRIRAAACILPLSDDRTISRELGTRHRAAIGTSETTDAVTLIVSEETGIISMAREGRLSRHLDAKQLTTLLTELLVPKETKSLGRVLSRRKEGQREK